MKGQKFECKWWLQFAQRGRELSTLRDVTKGASWHDREKMSRLLSAPCCSVHLRKKPPFSQSTYTENASFPQISRAKRSRAETGHFLVRRLAPGRRANYRQNVNMHYLAVSPSRTRETRAPTPSPDSSVWDPTLPAHIYTLSTIYNLAARSTLSFCPFCRFDCL